MQVELGIREQAVNEARGWIGVPFRHQGRTRAGIDCVGLLVCVGRAMGLPAYDVTGYSRRAQGMGFIEHFRANLEEVAPAAAQAGDVVVFVETVYPCHTGILSERHGALHLIHAHAPRRVVLEEPFVGEWRDKLRFAFRFPGAEET
jgi:cell wall-associated NlpC family hydrolase